MRLRRGAGAARGLDKRVVWLLGSPRSGTTWLLNLLGRRPEVTKIDEPGIGTHLGVFLHQANGAPARLMPPDRSLVSELRAQSEDYFFSAAYADVWRPALRELILARFAAQLEREGTPGALCVVKEPNGAQAVDLLLEALPTSRLLWLLRDGRDVVDSELDAIASGAWGTFERWEMTPQERLAFIEERGAVWVQRSELLERAFGRLPERQRLLVRYEDARADAAPQLGRVLGWLGIDADAETCERDAAAMAFERVPASQRGSGQFARSATPGAWSANLTADEQAVMERVMGPRLRALGYETSPRYSVS